MDQKIEFSALRTAAAEEIFNCHYDDLQGSRKYEDCFKDAAVILSPGCDRFGITPVATFGGLNAPEVPEELANQIRGKVYEPGFQVEYQGKSCLITFIAIAPTQPIDMDHFYANIESFTVRDGQMIPSECRVTFLTLIAGEAIDLNR